MVRFSVTCPHLEKQFSKSWFLNGREQQPLAIVANMQLFQPQGRPKLKVFYLPLPLIFERQWRT